MNIDIKFLLVYLQLIIITLMLLTVEGVQGGSRHFLGLEDIDGGFMTEELLRSLPPMKSTAQLYNRCSKASIHVPAKAAKISATISRNNRTEDVSKSYLELETYHELRGTTKVRIRGVATGRYICFNQKGRLVTKPCKRANDSGKFCEFKETVGMDGYTQFISKENPEWKITFNKAGDPLRGTEKRRKFDLCSDFLKLRLDSKHHHRHHHGEAPECVREDKNKYHHRKRKG